MASDKILFVFQLVLPTFKTMEEALSLPSHFLTVPNRTLKINFAAQTRGELYGTVTTSIPLLDSKGQAILDAKLEPKQKLGQYVFVLKFVCVYKVI